MDGAFDDIYKDHFKYASITPQIILQKDESIMDIFSDAEVSTRNLPFWINYNIHYYYRYNNYIKNMLFKKTNIST